MLLITWTILNLSDFLASSLPGFLFFGVLRSYHVESPKKANSNLYEGVQVSYIGLLKHAVVPIV